MSSRFMRPLLRWTRYKLCAAAGCLALLGACGGGTPRKLVVFGDSLADAGTFAGVRFTVQSGDAAAPTPLFPDYLQQYLDADAGALCPAFTTSDDTVVANSSAAACTSYAVGGGRIFNASAANTPLDIRYQMTYAASQRRAFDLDHIGLAGGGGNDAADLVRAYLGGSGAYQGFLAGLLSSSEITAALTADPSGQSAGEAYMQKLADLFSSSIQTQLLDKGLHKLILLNLPLITHTPRFLALLDQLSGTQAETVQAFATSWTEAYNQALASRFANNRVRVALIDLYTSYNEISAQPSAYGLSNVTDTACPATGVGSDGLPTYSLATCTVSDLDSSTPGWNTFLYADDFHPTPLGHQVIGQAIKAQLQAVGW